MAQVLFPAYGTDALRLVHRAHLLPHEYILPRCDQSLPTRLIRGLYGVHCGGIIYDMAEMYDGAGKRDEMESEKVY